MDDSVFFIFIYLLLILCLSGCYRLYLLLWLFLLNYGVCLFGIAALFNYLNYLWLSCLFWLLVL